MSRLTGTDVYGLMEAYQAVYAPQELTEEQVWEEVENWVNDLIEEGYDLSDCTWEEMYESYIQLDERLGAVAKVVTPVLKKVTARNPWNQFPKKPQPQLGIPKEGPSSRLPNRTLPPAGGTSAKPALPAAGQTGGKLASTARKPATGAARDPWKQFPKKPQSQLGIPKEGPSSRLPNRTLAPAGGTSAKPALPPAKTPSATPVKGGPLATTSKSTLTSPKGSPSNPDVIRTNRNVPNPKLPSGAGKALRVAGKLAGPAASALEVANEKSKGSGWARSLAKGAAVAAGGALGGAAGSVAGPVGTVAGATGGSMAASKAFDVAAGKNAVQRAADREANRKRQAGGALKGIGGPTSFDTKKGTMTTGSGSQKKTVQLAKTSVVKNPETGKAETGFLAYKGGKAIYKRAAKPGEGSSSALERIGRTFNPNAYKANDAKLAAQKLKQASQSDIKRQQDLGVKGSKNLVGPKIVGPKIVGAKPAPPKPPAGGGMGGKRGGR